MGMQTFPVSVMLLFLRFVFRRLGSRHNSSLVRRTPTILRVSCFLRNHSMCNFKVVVGVSDYFFSST